MAYSNRDLERHYRSLDAANEIYQKASLISLERGWDITRATEYVRKMDSRLTELEKCGDLPETENREYSMTSHEASAQIAERAKEIQKKEGCSYAEAVTKVYNDPSFEEVLRCYAQN